MWLASALLLIPGLLHGAVFHRPPTIDSLASALLTLLALAVTLAIALATRACIEAPVTAMGRRVAYRGRGEGAS